MTIRKVVAASSAAVYGSPDSTLLPLQENAPYGGVSPYADTKYRMEQLLHDFATTTAATATAEATTSKVSATALRFFNVYGPRQDPKNPYSGVISLFLQMAISNSDITILGDGYMTRDFVYVKDVARAIVLALLQEEDDTNDNNNFNIYNVCTGTSITINTLAKRIKSIMKSTSKIIHTTPRVGDIRESECNPTLAKVGLGFETVVSQESGLEKTADWFRQNIRR
jgi:UDP-glucose 4-epimerase